ncbi:hypothetical protein [Hymenobacter lucidus]|uniref:Uncharacterized protein n=1 Tax=Hymenobacter lucidus TaxID=2880930 RepID=A0ABS8AWK6_9BACT|nr:hypothetical protein [Hymenobacter lucidus]MCB2410177.1 hypothetical protein [Hymenobacter lucidus]
MNRKLSIDAPQVILGETSTLTLTLQLTKQDIRNTIGDVLRGCTSIELEFDKLSSGSEVHYHWPFTITADNQLKPDLNARADGQHLFDHISFSPKEISLKDRKLTLSWEVNGWDRKGTYTVRGHFMKGEAVAENTDFGPAKVRVLQDAKAEPVKVVLQETRPRATADETLWALIRRRTISFNRYRTFIDSLLCTPPVDGQGQKDRFLPFNRLASYGMLKYATELYLMHEAGLAIVPATGGGINQNSGQLILAGPDSIEMTNLHEEYLEQLGNEEGKVLPYFNLIREKLAEVPLKDAADLSILSSAGDYDICYGILKSKLQAPPLMELIWSYWHEEGGLVQTMNAISLRFQNVRQGNGRGPDPLASFNIDPLRPLNNLLWGYIEDERNRLTLNRRNLEYQYEYGIGLIGRAVQNIPVAEHRTFFLRGFHSLLRAATEFYQQANFTTVIPDGFPILNHLREVHLMLAEGAHNQYGDLPWTARSEMLTQQWLLARPEVREFLGGRIMVPYTEAWMDRVDNMKQLQGWNPTNITHFHDLASFGEQLLLSIRYGNWNTLEVGAKNAANWAHDWREEIQRYIHAYKAVTGVDLASEVVDARLNLPDNEERYLQPAQLIERQVALQQGQLQRNRQLSTPLAAPPLPMVGAPMLRRDAY